MEMNLIPMIMMGNDYNPPSATRVSEWVKPGNREYLKTYSLEGT